MTKIVEQAVTLLLIFVLVLSALSWLGKKAKTPRSFWLASRRRRTAWLIAISAKEPLQKVL